MSNNLKKTIAILIPVHNEEQMITDCIHSCLEQTRPLDQIIVVDDGSTDKTANILKVFGDSILVVTIPKATGNKSRAQEYGLAFITSDIVIATDGDTVLDKNFVNFIAQDFEADPDLSVVCGYVQSTKYNVLTALRQIDYTIGQDLYKRAQSIVNFVLVIPGCAGAFKTELFHNGEITFDHDTLTEDLDFTYKLNSSGRKIKLNFEARVYTQDPSNMHSYVNQMRRWYAGGWQNLIKHFGSIHKKPGAVLILTITYIDGMLFNIAMLMLLFINLTLFIKLFLLYTGISILMGLYASCRNRRLDMFFVSPLIPFMTIINAYLLFEQFILGVVLRKKNMLWFHPERRKHVSKNVRNLTRV